MRRDGITRPDQWADKWGIGRTALRTAMVGRQSEAGTWVRPDVRTLSRLGKALGVPLIYLIEQFYDDLGDAQALWPQVPVIGWIDAGGVGEEDIQPKYVPVNMDLALQGTVVAFRVRGNSMCSGLRPIYNGDVILVDSQNKSRAGSRVVARRADGSYVCRSLALGPTSTLSVRPSDNPSSAMIPLSSEEEVVGKIVEIRSFDT